MAIHDHFAKVCAAGSNAVAIDLDGKTISWAQWGASFAALDGLLEENGVGRDALVGLLGRNSLESVTGVVAALGSARALCLVNALRPTGLIVEEIEELRLICLLGGRNDLTPEVVRAAENAGTMLVAIDIAADGTVSFERLAPRGAGFFRERTPGSLIEIQTSGTTGKPKRIPIAESTFEASLKAGPVSATGEVRAVELKPKRSPMLMFAPLVHTSGTINTLTSVFEMRPIVLMEKFTAERLIKALRRYRPRFFPIPPAGIKMLVDSDATREDFSNVLAVRVGSAALPVDLQIQFEEKFGVPVLTTYGATEFMGTAARWTLNEHREFGASKRGSSGRAAPGAQLQVVDPATGEVLGPNQVGILEVKLDRLDGGRHWMRTSDLGHIDEDGFLFIVGRADDAIIRGGFKVMAGKVSDVLLQFPGVLEAIVMGRPDERLGEVPVAVVEPYPGQSIDPEELRAFAKEKLTYYEVPARFHVVEKLPRTVSDKVSKAEVKKLLASIDA